MHFLVLLLQVRLMPSRYITSYQCISVPYCACMLWTCINLDAISLLYILNDMKVNCNAYHTSDAIENFLYNNDSGAIHFTGSLVPDVTL